MRRRLALVLVMAVAIGAAALSLPSMIRGLAEQRAAARGLSVEIDALAIRPTRIWLSGVRVTRPDWPELSAELSTIEVRFGIGGVREVIVHGGEVRVTGTRELWWDRLRGERRSAPAATLESAPMPISAHGIHVVWEAREQERYHAWGLRLARDPRRLKARADLLRMQHPALQFDAKHAELDLSLPELALSRATAAETRVTVVLGADGTPSPTPEHGASNGNAPQNTASNAAASPNAPRMDAQERGTKSRIPALDPGRGERVRAWIARMVGVVARRIPEQSSLDLDGVTLTLRYGDDALNLGPARLSGARGAEQVTISFSPGARSGPDAELVDFSVRAPISEGPVQMHVGGGPIALSSLGVRDGDFGLTNVGRARLKLELALELSADGQLARVETSGEAQRVSLAHARVAPEPLTELSLAWSGKGELHLNGSALDVERAELELGAVSAEGRLSLKRDEQRVKVDTELRVPLASCQDMFDSLPSAIVPLLAGMRLGGTFSWDAALSVDTAELSKAKTRWRMQNDCRITEVPAAASTQRFRAPFSRMVPAVDGQPLLVWSGPGTTEWVPLAQVSRYLETAVLTTEDGGFWAHKGFDQKAIEGSIKQNIQAGRFVRGASTISMQVAKNLYLSRDKHVSRKVQEALLTMLLEQELRKDEILELYFNIIEFGPDVWGIKMAADHYFNAKPHELSLAQSFFLASILPNPKGDYFEPDGQLKPYRRNYVQRLMRIAHERQRLSAAELALGLEQSVLFGVPHLLTDDARDELDYEDPYDRGMPDIPGP